MSVSSDVSAGDSVLASQYNNLRDDVLDTSTGHTHNAVDSKNLAPEHFTVTPTSAIIGLTIDQDNDASALVIDSENTSTYAVTLNSKFGLNLVQDLADGRGLYCIRNLNEAGSFPLAHIIENHTSSTQSVLEIDNDGKGHDLYIHKDDIKHDANKHSIYVYSDIAETSAALVKFNMDSASSDQQVLFLHNDGTGKGMTIDQDGNGVALEIDNSGTEDGIFLNQDGNGVSLDIDSEATSASVLNLAAINTSGIVVNIDNQGNQAAGNLVKLNQDHASSAASCLEINNDGSGASVNANGASNCHFTIINKSLADDGSVALETILAGGQMGMLMIIGAGANRKSAGIFSIHGAYNSVTVTAHENVQTADVDDALCVIADGDGTYTLKNRTGATDNFTIIWIGTS